MRHSAESLLVERGFNERGIAYNVVAGTVKLRDAFPHFVHLLSTSNRSVSRILGQ